MASQKKKYRSLQVMLKTGEAARFALLNAQLELDTAMLSRLNALIEAQQSLGVLEDALQCPFDLLNSSRILPKSNPQRKKSVK